MSKVGTLLLGILVGLSISGMAYYFFGGIKKSKEFVSVTNNDQVPDTVYVQEKQLVEVPRKVETNTSSSDTVLLLSNLNQNVDSGEYVVLRDKLLHSERVKLIKNSGVSSSSASDRLSERMSTDDFFLDHIQVEFWESPIDYQGYRLNKAKLILFGINPNESFLLTLDSPGVIAMQTGELKVLLQPTEKYRSFNFQ